ncbi:MAG TPA: ACT domain-containing protein [Anaeromyxobacteraceae bacterium]|nr:ACT domain-containing protein [Anaeromyxobacteraceae bacterium]
MPRAKALIVRVEDRPGVLGEVMSALGAKKINVRAVHGGNEEGQGIIRLVADKFAAAKKVLASRGWTPQEEEVLEVEVSDRPGALGSVAQRLGDAGVNVKYVFVGPGGARKATVFLAVSDLKAALKALR